MKEFWPSLDVEASILRRSVPFFILSSSLKLSANGLQQLEKNLDNEESVKLTLAWKFQATRSFTENVDHPLI